MKLNSVEMLLLQKSASPIEHKRNGHKLVLLATHSHIQ